MVGSLAWVRQHWANPSSITAIKACLLNPSSASSSVKWGIRPHLTGALVQKNERMWEKQRFNAWHRADSLKMATIIITSVDREKTHLLPAGMRDAQRRGTFHSVGTQSEGVNCGVPRLEGDHEVITEELLRGVSGTGAGGCRSRLQKKP